MPSLQTDEKAILYLYDHLPDAIVWYEALRDSANQVIDFEVSYCNHALSKNLNIPADKVLGSRLSTLPYTDQDMHETIVRQCMDVMRTGETVEASYYSQLYDQFFHVTRIRVLDGVLNVIRNRTREWKLELEKREQTTLIEQIINTAPACIVLCQAIRSSEDVEDFLVLSVNEKIVRDMQRPRTEIEGQTYCSLHPHIRSNGYFHMMSDVIRTGTPFRGEMYLPPFGGWLYVSADRLEGDKLVVICLDINETKQAATEREQLAEQLSSILDASLSGMCSLRAQRDAQGKISDMVMERVNRRFEQLTGRKPVEVQGKSYLEIYPHAITTGFFDKLVAVIESGKAYREVLPYNGNNKMEWVEASVCPMGKDGVVVSFDDVTEKKQAELKIDNQRNLLDNILKFSPAGISVTRLLRDESGRFVDTKTVLINEIAQRFTGVPIDVSLNKRGSEIVPGLTESPLFAQAVHTVQTGEAFNTQYFLEPTGRWLELSVSRLDEEHLINVFTDITSGKEAQLAIERSAENLKKVINSAQVGMFTFYPEFDEDQTIIDFRFGIVNYAVSGYVEQDPETLSGRLGTEYFPNYKATGVFEMYRETFETGKSLRREVHYRVDGHDNFLDIQSTRLDDSVLVTFTDLTPIRRAQGEMERLIEELKQSNANLEEFAYAASHDLKEPIRKIHFFAERLFSEYGQLLDEKGRNLFERMQSSAERMRTLVEDLLSYSQVSLRPKHFEELDLQSLMRVVLMDLELEVEEQGAVIEVGQLPEVCGHKRQLQQLFINLLGNSLKYVRQGVRPEIHIRYRACSGHEAPLSIRHDDRRKTFHLIEVSDNGIGFEQKDADRIFQVFQRLHGNAEYRGTGVGLAIARKVAENHGGYIEASGIPGEGATFRVLLPA